MPDKMAAGEVESPVKQCITILDKKIRNLEKRKVKLDAYKALEDGELNKDQKEAIAKYEVVLQNIEFAKDLHKHFLDISAEADKKEKKQAKKEKGERHQQDQIRMQEWLKLNSVLNALGNDAVRDDFRNGKSTSLVLTEEQLQQLDDFYQMVFPIRDAEHNFAEQLTTSSEHLMCYLEQQDKKVLNTTYKDLRNLIDCINNSGYFDKKAKIDTEIQSSTSNVLEMERYDELAADDIEDNGLQARNEPDEPTNDVCVAQELLVDHSLTSHILAQQADPYHASNWSHAASLVTQQATVMAPNVSATTGVIAMTTVQVERPPQVAGAFSDGAYYSGFPKQRPLQEIVSSLQGNYNFLQESQIDLEGHSQTSSDVAYSSYDNQNSGGQPMPAFNPQTQSLGPQPAIDQPAGMHPSQQVPRFDHGPCAPPPAGQIYHAQGSTAATYGVQGLHHNVYSHHQMTHEAGYEPNYGQQQQTAYVLAHQMNPTTGNDQQPTSSHLAAAAATMNVAGSVGPQPIPLPGQMIHGRSLTDQGGFGASQSPPSSADITEAMAKKQFTMNPNADIFRSVVYEESSPTATQISASDVQPSGANDGQMDRSYVEAASRSYQGTSTGGGGYGSNFSSSSGGSVRGNRSGRGVHTARDPAINNGGVQLSGRGGGPSNAGRVGATNIGANGQRGGLRGGPPRGANSSTRGISGRGFGRNNQQSTHEQPTHA